MLTGSEDDSQESSYHEWDGESDDEAGVFEGGEEVVLPSDLLHPYVKCVR